MSPSKEETKEFLTKKLTWNDRYDDLWIVEFEGDTLILKRRSQLSETQHYLRLSDLNPNRVSYDTFEDCGRSVFRLALCVTDSDSSQVEYRNYQRKKVGKEFKLFERKINPGNTSRLGYPFLVRDAHTARQAQKALVHLIKLCGGKAELFDD